MLATCYKCQKQSEYWEMRPFKEAIFLKGKELNGASRASKYFCPLKERKIRTSYLPETQEKVLIMDCLNGDREEIRDKIITK